MVLARGAGGGCCAVAARSRPCAGCGVVLTWQELGTMANGAKWLAPRRSRPCAGYAEEDARGRPRRCSHGGGRRTTRGGRAEVQAVRIRGRYLYATGYGAKHSTGHGIPRQPRKMELGVRLRSCQPPPNTSQPPPIAISFGAWPRSSHLAVVLRGRPCPRRPRRARAPWVAAPDSRPLETIRADRTGQGTKLRGDKFFPVEMTVRDCELDHYGVVNNAVYADYIEKAREELASSLGISRCSIASTGNAMALSGLKLNYFAPLKRGARFVVMVRVVQIKGARMLVEHFIETLPERKLVLEATATVVCLNKDYRPTRVFPEVASKVLRFFSP
ncbi:uncharacterized protein C2845_PM11G31200 [Panicum miliaceum]|uniref:Uncharacterized protein n=1 Tax=Panicum miliaceum TaxID=4540 RepID=A0A3L6RNP0_PANMI|nr:uncharacterized protein C2845_PM11G31200 [Panicum miliaceum]